MLLEDESSVITIPQHNRKKKRRNSFFFSSLRALTRSKMTRGKKVVLKTSAVGVVELGKSLCFEGGVSIDEVVVVGHNFDALSKGTQETFRSRKVAEEAIVATVSFFRSSFISLSFMPSSNIP